MYHVKRGKGYAQEYRSHQYFRGTKLKEVVFVAVDILFYTYLMTK